MNEIIYDYKTFLIIHRKYLKDFCFEILDHYGYVICYSDYDLKLKLSSYDSCFRAARKWMRDNQNIIYKEV